MLGYLVQEAEQELSAKRAKELWILYKILDEESKR